MGTAVTDMAVTSRGCYAAFGKALRRIKLNLSEFFYALTPDAIIAAVEDAGYLPSGRFMQLNSLENRVYSFELEDASSLIAKFYRPGRWTRDQIQEEHSFLSELRQAGACAPLGAAGKGDPDVTLHETSGIYYALWEKAPGRVPDELDEAALRRLGSAIAGLHAIGERNEAVFRPRQGPDSLIRVPLRFVLDEGLVPARFAPRYERAALAAAEALERALKPLRAIRLHGDCHWGNILREGDRFRFIDFDDFAMGPAAQDLWMLASSGESQSDALLEGYRTVRPLDERELDAFGPLKAGRFVHYAAWIARRREDPAFKLAFPDFGTEEYWERETIDLEAIVRDGLSPLISEPAPPDPEWDDVSKLTNKDYFYDM